MMRRSALARFAGITALLLLLTQAGAVSLSHLHGVLPGGLEAGYASSDPSLPQGDGSGHGALECRVCRIRGAADGDLALRGAAGELPLPQLLPGRTADACRTLHPVWHPGPQSARAPPVLS